ncbi:MAG: DeoR/GlpR family DNA-binding transcription regulator [Mobilitalea sp.]
MLAEERFSEILKIIEERKRVTAQELTDLLNTSESTIRRDLTLLNKRGMLKKIHGGAMAIDMTFYAKDDTVEARQMMNQSEKTAIAKYAASLIEADDFVYIDAGTTTELMIDFITVKNVTFVTNGMVHARKLVKSGNTAYMLGGELKSSTDAVVGDVATKQLSRYNFTKGFFGTNGARIDTGFSTPEVNEAMVKSMAFEHCSERYVLCDPSKFNQIAPITFADFNKAQVITTVIKDATYRNCSNILEVGI